MVDRICLQDKLHHDTSQENRLPREWFVQFRRKLLELVPHNTMDSSCELPDQALKSEVPQFTHSQHIRKAIRRQAPGDGQRAQSKQLVIYKHIALGHLSRYLDRLNHPAKGRA